MTSHTDSPESFRSFVEFISVALGLAVTNSAVAPSTPIGDVVGDSLAMLELWVILEELGLDLPEALFATMETIGDVHHYAVVKGAAFPY